MNARRWLAAALFLAVLLPFAAAMAALLPAVPAIAGPGVVLVLYPLGVWLDLLPPGRPGAEDAALAETAPAIERARIRHAVPPSPGQPLVDGYIPLATGALAGHANRGATAAPGASHAPLVWKAAAGVGVLTIGLVLITVAARAGGGGARDSNPFAVAGVRAPVLPPASPSPEQSALTGAGALTPSSTVVASPTSTSAVSTPTLTPTPGSPAPLAGRYELVNTVTSGGARGQSFRFAVTFRQQRDAVLASGDGLRIEGQRAGDVVRASYDQAGSSGLFEWTVQQDGSLTGSFRDAGSGVTGTSAARPLP